MAKPEFEKCYLCLTWKERDQMTDDHVPPKSYFPPPRPTDLISVRSCEACNSKYSMDDEAFRAWVAAAGANTPAGSKIWDDGVMNSSFKRSPKLRANMSKHLKVIALEEADGSQTPVTVLTFPDSRGDRIGSRLTKAMLKKFHPDYDYTYDDFLSDGFSPEVGRLLRQCKIRFTTGHRGVGVYRFGYKFSAGRRHGIWFFNFYTSAMLVVIHGAGVGRFGNNFYEAVRNNPSLLKF